MAELVQEINEPSGEDVFDWRVEQLTKIEITRGDYSYLRKKQRWLRRINTGISLAPLITAGALWVHAPTEKLDNARAKAAASIYAVMAAGGFAVFAVNRHEALRDKAFIVSHYGADLSDQLGVNRERWIIDGLEEQRSIDAREGLKEY